MNVDKKYDIIYMDPPWRYNSKQMSGGSKIEDHYPTMSMQELKDLPVNELTNNGGVYPIPLLAFAAFQLMFAIITPALIAGAFAERVSFKAYIIFIAIWGIFVYNPLCHWVWAADGFLLLDGAIDFANVSYFELRLSCYRIGSRRPEQQRR